MLIVIIRVTILSLIQVRFKCKYHSAKNKSREIWYKEPEADVATFKSN